MIFLTLHFKAQAKRLAKSKRLFPYVPRVIVQLMRTDSTLKEFSLLLSFLLRSMLYKVILKRN